MSDQLERFTSKRIGSQGDSSSSGRILPIGSLVAVVVSIVGSIVGHGALPAQMRIHWTFGLGPYYGPEFAPTLWILTLFPVLTIAVALGANWVLARFRNSGELAVLRPSTR